MSYETIREQLRALTQGIPHKTANLANASALLSMTLPDLNWVGFYLLEGETLVLGPFQGKPACIEIPMGRGVCGTAAAQDGILLVPDVHQFPGHIACDGVSRSELVMPLHKNGQVAAVLDLDSPTPGRFTEADRAGMALLQPILEALL
ncbi:MAG: GAF domain-containing protein [Candidatus Faecousia sp.]|nr:GAF domain-containing protein [Clostridiales bacterium]MDD7651225.1 GAF domain-containing protein [Bacillota bacterium]MDY4219501.1 GAF domain-containing protein [Candidatus Faecousia sp.]